jgi:preprotein translocase subunit SecG
MRFIGILIALGIIGWVMYQASGGDDNAGIIPESYQQSMEKAEGVEQTVQDAAQRQLEEIDRKTD